MSHETITFGPCEGWYFRAADDSLATDAGRPAVVMAHGLAGTKDSGLAPFAEGLATAGLDVLAFDYRGFGGSRGGPRQTVSVARQREDYRAALRAAAGLPDVDGTRLVLWGESLSGGTVLPVAVGRTDVAAVISMVPLVDGLAAGRHAMRSGPSLAMARTSAIGAASRLGALAGRSPAMLPVVARPGEVGLMTAPGYYEDYLSIAGPTWRNELAATVVSELGPTYRPVRAVRGLRDTPWLVQIADHDRSAPPHSAAKAAFRGRAEVRHYPCDHFGTQVGKPWHEAAVAHQSSFLRRVLRTTR